MDNSILIVVISAGLGALVNCLFQLIYKILDLYKANKEKAEEKKDTYISKKEEVYIAALDRLLQVKRSFDYTQEDILLHDNLKKMANKQSQEFMTIAPKLRLYASDNIFNQYQNLMLFSRYSYVPENAPRLMEEAKEIYSIQITLLARCMQEDLGYRQYSKELDMIQCPKCKTMHDIVGTCPKCKMTYKQLQEILQQNISKVQNIEKANKNDIQNNVIE